MSYVTSRRHPVVLYRLDRRGWCAELPALGVVPSSGATRESARMRLVAFVRELEGTLRTRFRAKT